VLQSSGQLQSQQEQEKQQQVHHQMSSKLKNGFGNISMGLQIVSAAKAYLTEAQ
jgi:hypothetical protein